MIRMKIAFALRLVDDFSGQCIRKGGILFSSGGKVVHPVEKAEGLYIFLEPQERETRVFIEGPDYHACSVLVQKELLDPEEPVADVRMHLLPGREHSRLRGWLTGSIEAASMKTVSMEAEKEFPGEVYAKKSSPTGLAFRECQHVEGGCWASFQGFTKEKLTGRTYVLDDGNLQAPFVIVEKRGINEYRIEPLGISPDKIRAGTPLVRLYRSVTDRRGVYAIPVDAGEEDHITEVRILQHTSPS